MSHRIDRPRRALRLVRRVALAAATLALLALAAWIWVVPGLVEQRIRGALTAGGVRDVQLRLAVLTLHRAELEDIAFGGNALRASRVVARFSPASLLAGRVEEVRVEGAVYDRALPWPLRGASGPRVATEAEASTPLPALPFDRLVIDDARIVASEVAATEVRFDAKLAAGAGGWQGSARGTALGGTFSADLDLRADVAGAAGPVSVRLEHAASAGLVVRGTAHVATGAGGRELNVELASDGESFEVDAGDVAAAGHGLTLRAHIPLARIGDGTATVDLTGLDVHARDAWRIEGLDGTVRLGPLVPLQTAGTVELAWSALSMGKVSAEAGDARFTVETGPALVVDQIRCTLEGGGSLTVGGFRLARDNPSITAVVTVEGAPLDAWLDLASDGRVRGSGRLDGELEVRITLGEKFDLDLPRGRLRAAGGGTLRIVSGGETEDLVRQHARAVARAAGKEVERAVEDRIVGAMKEFAFDELRFDLVATPASAPPPVDDGTVAIGNGWPGGTTLRVHAAGKGLRVPQELSVDLNFHGFDQVVDLVRATRLGLDRAAKAARDRSETTHTPKRNRP